MWFRNIFNARPGLDAVRAGGAGISAGALRQLNRLYLNTALMRPDAPSGSRPSQVRRPAAEFRDHRQYAPGDDIRFVDWKASARQEHIFIKQGEQQKAARVFVVLDCSASMAWGSPSKSETALALAHALAYLALAHGDRLSILPVGGGQQRPLGPLWGKGQAALLGRYAAGLQFAGQADLTSTLRDLDRAEGKRGGFVLVLSDLLGTLDLSRALAPLPAPVWSVAVCHLLHPAELDPPVSGYLEMQDIETSRKQRFNITRKALDGYRQHLGAWLEQLENSCRERRAVYTLLRTDESLENDLLPKLMRARIVKRL